jgi:hypothetical protein
MNRKPSWYPRSPSLLWNQDGIELAGVHTTIALLASFAVSRRVPRILRC